MIEPDYPQNFCREVVTWKRLSHPNVLELIGATMDDTAYTTVTLWMENGSIIDFLRKDVEANPLKLACASVPFYAPLIDSGHS